MNTKSISSLLVVNDDGRIVGIVTERDVMRRLTLLDVADKLERAIGTIATREVHFVDHRRIHETIVKLHFEKGIRHFPVLKGPEPTLTNLAGMLTVTDLLRYYLRDEATRAAEQAAEDDGELPRKVAVVTFKPEAFAHYKRALSRPTVKPVELPPKETVNFFKTHAKGEMPLVIDMDGWPVKKLGSLIALAKPYKGQLILTVSHPDVVTLFRKFLAKGRQTIAAKPFDPDYLVWLLTAANA